ncbi:MAG: thiamine pyrophosphate-dependent enzyme, partial [Hyphomicrobiaceae bacterium]
LGRGAFQEVAVEPLVGTFTKWAATARDTSRLPELLSHAFHEALSGRPGPVILGLPEDVLDAASDVDEAPTVTRSSPTPSWQDLGRLADALEHAEWPMVLAGGTGWTPPACAALTTFAERFDLPVVASFRSQDVIDNRSRQYVGHAGRAMSPKLQRALASADLVIAIGTHFDETTTGSYRALPLVPGRARRTLVHVHPSPGEIGRLMATDLPIVSTVTAFTERLEDVAPSVRCGMRQRWSTLRRDLRSTFETWQAFPPSPGRLRLESVVRHMSETLPADAIVTNGAGNYAAFLHRAYTWKAPATQLAPVSGSMGYGLPAAIAAKLAEPTREVVCLAGDGCLQMSIQELATAAQLALPIVVLVANNNMLGTIRAEQERRYPGRVVATSLVNPDVTDLARAYGFHAERVDTDDAFPAAFARARRAASPALIELVLDPAALAPGEVLADRISPSDS